MRKSNKPKASSKPPSKGYTAKYTYPDNDYPTREKKLPVKKEPQV